MDPGPNFVWGRDEYDQATMAGLLQSGEPAEHLGALASYLDLVKVSLPEWVLDQTDFNNHPHHHPSHLHLNHQKKKMQSMAKQFGSLGKKFRKNLSKITQTVGGGSGYGKFIISIIFGPWVKIAVKKHTSLLHLHIFKILMNSD